MDGIKGIITTIITLLGLILIGWGAYQVYQNVQDTVAALWLDYMLTGIIVFYIGTIAATWTSTIYLYLTSDIRFASGWVVFRWLAFSLFVFPLKASAYIVAPALGLAAAIVDGDTVYGPFKIYMTNDADFTAYYGDSTDHSWGRGENVVSRFIKRTRWLARNKFFYGLSVLFGKRMVGETRVYKTNEETTLFVLDNDLFGIMYKPTYLGFIKLRIKSGWASAGEKSTIWSTISLGH